MYFAAKEKTFLKNYFSKYVFEIFLKLRAKYS